MRQSIKVTVKKAVRGVEKISNSFGNKRECYICGRRFSRFSKYGRGSRGTSELLRRLDMIGSDVDNFGCMYCNSHDRERHLFMFFDKLQLWGRLRNARVLHFAPETNLSKRIAACEPMQYVRADLYSDEAGIERIDATSIPFDGNTFDFLIANHILEHIPNYLAAVGEFYRILKPGGVGILQTPYSRLLKRNFEENNINTDELRLFFYGEKDHLRTFSEHGLKQDIEQSGLRLKVIRHDEYFDDASSYLYGVNRDEDLLYVHKPMLDEARSD